ncbi:radical SAM protein [Planctomycetota bacterium]|nr:radical SAM protein [Planctomycetota bacterium]
MIDDPPFVGGVAWRTGRGSAANPANRFEGRTLVFDGDLDPAEDPSPQTSFVEDDSQGILSRNDSPDVPFAVGLNPYRGCEHGCPYCYARVYHEYAGMSAGLDFETKILVKPRAAELLRGELNDRRWTPQVIGLSGATDCYQPVERRLRLTRACLAVLAEYRNPVRLITKNALVTRDIDLLTELARHQAVSVALTITSLDPDLARELEPRASAPAARLAAIRTLAAAGIPAAAHIAPVIPGLNDHEIPAILAAAKDAGATSAGWQLLRLPGAVGGLFADWLERFRPTHRTKILARLDAVHGGNPADNRAGHRHVGEGVIAEQISQLFSVMHRRHQFTGWPELSTASFRRPGEGRQLTIFDD